MADFTIVGSGATGVHFALSVLQRGYSVEMLDIGWVPDAPVNPGENYTQLKHSLDDPCAYFLGERFEGVVLPGSGGEFYGIPPSKNYVLKSVPQFRLDSDNFAPAVSFARGGLAEAWTAGCYPFNDHELEDFPFNYADIGPYYNEIAARIGINGAVDDLSDFIPIHDGLQTPLRMDEHSQLLLARYRSQRKFFRQKLDCRIGRSRYAVLSSEFRDRERCGYLGRCLWGCPSRSIYTPSVTLEECRSHRKFTYTNHQYVNYFQYDEEGRINRLMVESVDGKKHRKIDVNTLVLAAGTLSTARIFLESVYRGSGRRIRLPGLMDNRQVHMPFLNFSMIGRPIQSDSYQFNQLALGLETQLSKHYIHGLITTLKTSMIHPIVEKLPFDLKTSLHLFRNLHAALGLVNINFHDTRRDENHITLADETESAHPKLRISYSSPDTEAETVKHALKRVRRALLRLGCFAPPGMVYVRPTGGGVHYAGTLPMSASSKTPWTTTPDCQSRDFDNLYIVDGSTYPFLPAKNITFTLMANAVRVADRAIDRKRSQSGS